MGDPIKIVVTAETAAAAAAMRDFLKTTDTGLKEVVKSAGHAEGALMGNRMALMELGHVGRATAESLAFGMNPLKVLALESPRIVQALSMMGVSLATMVPFVAAVGAAVGAGYIGWKLYMAGVEDTTKANEELVKSLDKVPAILERIQKLQNAGLISPAAAQEFADYLGKNPKIQLYKQSDGQLTRNKTENVEEFYHTGDPFKDQTTHMVENNLPKATPAEASDWVSKQALPQVSDAELENANKLKDLLEKIRVDGLEGTAKQIAIEHDEFEKRREQLLLLAQQAGDLIGPKQLDAATVGGIAELNRQEAEGKITIEKKAQAEIDRQNADLQKTYDDFLQSERDLEKSISDEEEKQRKELAQQLTLKQEIARASAQAQLDQIKSNQFLTGSEKAQQSVPVIQSLLATTSGSIADKQAIASDPNVDVSAQLEAKKQMVDLMVQQAHLQQELQAAQGNDSLASNFLSQWTAMSSQVQALAQDMAKFTMAPFEGMRAGLASAFDTLLEYGSTAKQFFGTIALDIGRSMISAFSDMVANWIMSHVVMAAVSSIFHLQEAAKAMASQTAIVTITGAGSEARIIIRTGEAAHDAAMTGAQVGTHAAGEGAKTGATIGGAMMRGIIRLGETIFHGVMVAMRVAAHVAGEILSTGVTMVQAVIRSGAHVIEAAVGAMAAMASIPYVGPILALAAATAMVMAGMGLMHGFADGGFTGAGGRDEVAGVVHRGEYVFPQSAVNRIGVGNLEALHRGGIAAAGGASGGNGGNPEIHNFIYHDKTQLMNDLAKSDAFEKNVIDVMNRTIHRFR